MPEADHFTLFRRTCTRLAKPRSQVRIYTHNAQGATSVNFLEDDASESNGESFDFREIDPDWLRPIDGAIKLDAKIEHDRSDRYLEVFLDERGAWQDQARTKPLFKEAKRKVSLRDAAIATLGIDRVEEAERVINETVDFLLASPALRKEGFRFKGKPKIAFRWATGKSRGGLRGLSFALLHHAKKPETGALFKEYARLAADPEIGNFAGTRQDCYRALAAHELAHWFQYAKEVSRPEGRYNRPHGESFRRIYRLLRRELASTDKGTHLG